MAMAHLASPLVARRGRVGDVGAEAVPMTDQATLAQTSIRVYSSSISGLIAAVVRPYNVH